jgi:hypothetical protein
LLGSLCLGATAVLSVAIARAFDQRAAWPTAVLWASSPLLLRVAAECYSEPPFLLLMAIGTWLGLQRRFVAVGACAAVAFWIRPEGLLLAASFVLVEPRAAWRALLPVAAGVLGLAAGRGAAGQGFDPLPLLAFHEQRDDLPERGNVLANVLALPGPWFEAFGLAGLCALLAPWRRLRPLTTVLRWQVALQVAAICTFVVRRRFFLSCAVPVMVLAGVALARAPRRLAQGALVLAVGLGFWLAWNGRIDADRAVERDLGALLAPQLVLGRSMCSELPRVAWFAGAKPGPPRHFTAKQWLEQAQAPEVTIVVLANRTVAAFTAAERAVFDQRFEPASLPASLQAGVAQRRLQVFLRR